MNPYSGPRCGICGEPFPSEHGLVCAECITKPPAFSRAFSYGLYEGTLEQAVKALKFSKIKRLSREMGKLLRKIPLPETDGIAAVPLSRKGLLERGFNQSLLLAKEISDFSGTPLLPNALFKIKETRPQALLSKKDRLANLKGAFMAGEEAAGNTILLVDDVMTTGATLHECSKALLKAGAKEVFAATLARASF
jgi:ComF family protein